MQRASRVMGWRFALPALVGGAAVGGLLVVASVFQALGERRSVNEAAAAVAADQLAVRLTAISSSIAGADALAVDGSVSEAEFRAFAEDVVDETQLTALAFAEPVAEQERSAWEAATGLSMRDTDGRGGWAPAAERSNHVVVRFAEPDSPITQPVLGFDLLSDPIRAQGVAESGASGTGVLVGPTRLATSGQPGVFVITAVRDRSGEIIGYLSSGASLETTLADLRSLPDITVATVDLDGVPLLGDAGEAAASVSVTVTGRTFVVSASSRKQMSWTLPVLLALPTAGLTAGALVIARRRGQVQHRRDRESYRSEQLALLSEDLVNVATVQELLRAVANRAGRVVNASYTNVARRDPTDPSKLQVVHDDGMNLELSERFAYQDVADELPLPEVIRTGRPVFVANQREYRQQYPQVINDVHQADIHAICCVPLGLADDASLGVIGFAFNRPLDKTNREEIVSAAMHLSQLAGRALERAAARELIAERVQRLADFARALTTSRTSDDVAQCVERMLPPLLELLEARLSPTSHQDDDETRCYPPPAPDGDYLVLRHAADRAWTAIDETVATTVVDLVGGALTRTRLYDHERAVLTRFQETLLTRPPSVPGMDIAVGYRSAIEAVGMGGDWYSVIDTTDAVYAVIGDIAGHGPSAVALMAEVKTVIRHLLTNGTSLEATLEHAHRTLLRRKAYASAVAVRIDKLSDHIAYLNAGHPPIAVIDTNGMELLSVVHRPWLGVETQTSTATTGLLKPGQLLLLYTDGLVEEREISLSMRRFVIAFDQLIRQPVRMKWSSISSQAEFNNALLNR